SPHLFRIHPITAWRHDMPASVHAALITSHTPRHRAARFAGTSMSGVVDDYLKDPGGTLLAILHHLHEWAIAHELIIMPVLTIAVGALMVMPCWWARRCHAQFLAHARLITVLLP